MKWIEYKEDDEKTQPPLNKNVFMKAFYKNTASYIMGIGINKEYGAPHWNSGIKLYGNSKLPDAEPIKILWLDESPSGDQPQTAVGECPKCESKNIRWNKHEIEVGDKTGSVADIQYQFCEDCGHRFQIDWFD